MRLSSLFSILTISLTLTACVSYDFSRQEAQQGNLLPAAKIERLQIGMSKDDAAILMGTSMLSPSFNNDRWDYAYTLRTGNKLAVKTLSLYFAHNVLVKIEKHA